MHLFKGFRGENREAATVVDDAGNRGGVFRGLGYPSRNPLRLNPVSDGFNRGRKRKMITEESTRIQSMPK